MRFPLRILTGGKLELEAFAICGTGKTGPVTFIIDTGAEISSIGEKDIRALGLKSKDFEKYVGKPIVGIGGKSKPLLIRDVTIVLHSEEGSEEFLTGQDFVYHKAVRSKRRRRKGLEAYEEVAVFRAPSIFGTDLLHKLGLILHYDTRRGIAYLGKP